MEYLYAAKGMLAAFGPKVTLLILVAVGVFKAAQSIGGFFERMLARRDEMLTQTMERIVQMDERRAEHDKDTAVIMATMRADIASQLNEARDLRKETHQRFNKIQEDITTIKGAVA